MFSHSLIQRLTKLCLTILFIGLIFQSVNANQNDKERNQIPEKYKWNLGDLFTSQEDWQKSKKDVALRSEKVGDYKGTLGNSAIDLYQALDYYYQVLKEFYILWSYANMLSDEDTRESSPLSMKQELEQLWTNFEKVSAYINPEILAISQDIINQYFHDEPRLKIYRHIIDNIQRTREHTLSEVEEELIAEAGRMANSAQNAYSIFSNADMIRPTVILSTGEEVILNSAGYSKHRSSPVREDRIKVMNAFFSELDKYRRTFGTLLSSEIQSNIFYKNVRRYNSSLENSTDRDNIPTSVYKNLIKNVNDNLSTLHRYLKLRKRMLGVDELHYYDIYPPLVKSIDLRYSYEEAEEIIKKALSVLGEEYIEILDKAFKDRWIDVYPNTGKRSGAYSNGAAYDVHPYILMNYNDKYDDMSTLAHELGHTMHSYFSNKSQPFPNSDYPTFLAEVASTVNEALLIDYVLKDIDAPEIQLSILGNYLENFRGTMFRQTQFAEFELKIHQISESGEALTGDKFTEIYLDILKKYYGHDVGVMIIDDRYGIEWAFIPHFYYNFYVYQYSTSYLASQVVADKMLKGDSTDVKQYIDFISSGGSDYAISILKEIGIDMTTDEPFNIGMIKMNSIMDKMEEILDEVEQ
ncbi:oligoendopeptidase F [Candidatus Neomarinimicrobiota bacterium]